MSKSHGLIELSDEELNQVSGGGVFVVAVVVVVAITVAGLAVGIVNGYSDERDSAASGTKKSK